ncbi:MAG: hypothetical protein R2873_34625 [Caldilineaceae bacterium]
MNEDVLGVAWRNLDLLNVDGMDRRIAEICVLADPVRQGIPRLRWSAAQRFRSQLLARGTTSSTSPSSPPTPAAADIAARLPQSEIDIVLADVPYGWHTSWQLSDRNRRCRR